MANEATPACLMTHEELLTELRENPQVGDSWTVFDCLKREIIQVKPLILEPLGITSVQSITEYIKGTFSVGNIKLVPRTVPIPTEQKQAKSVLRDKILYTEILMIVSRNDIKPEEMSKIIHDMIKRMGRELRESFSTQSFSLELLLGNNCICDGIEDILFSSYHNDMQKAEFGTVAHKVYRFLTDQLPRAPRPNQPAGTYTPGPRQCVVIPETPTIPKPEGRRYTTTIIDDPMPVETPCQIAQRITTADRCDVYGHPADDFKRIADMWSAYLGVSITAEQVGMCQILVKVGRLAHTPGHWDSICDMAGYSNCLGMILQRDKDTTK